MDVRTDLAIEKQEFLDNDAQKGIVKKEKKFDKGEITEIEIVNEEGEKALGKPKGKYITIEISEFSYDSEILDSRLTSITNEIKSLIPQSDKPVLVVGIGNENITPDALGPLCIKSVFSTRHIDNKLATEIGFEHLHPVCALATGVLGQTGIETGEIIKSVVNSINPSVVILIDALASASLHRLGRTVQITNTGITPGSGVGNSRKEISFNTIGVPVIAIGVPTVVDAVTLAKGITQNADFESDSEEAKTMMVTPREIDVVIERAAKLLALSVNCALQPEIEPEILLSVV